MFLSHKHRRRHFKITTELSLIRLVLAIGIAGVDTVWALYMDSFGLSESTIGFIAAGLVIISLGTAFFSTPILEKYNEVKILAFSFFITITSYIAIYFLDEFYIFLLLAIILTISSVFRLDSFDILFRDESKKKELNGDEGLMYALTNVGWLVGPLIAGFVLIRYGLQSVFISSAAFVGMALWIFLSLNIKAPNKKRDKIDGNFFENIRDFLKNKKLIMSYLISGGIETWWALIYIYVPLFIINNGLGEGVVGVFLACIVIPLVLFEYEVGKLSEKIGFKLFFFYGFIMLAALSILAFFSTDIYLTLIILVLASIPMSLLEPLQDSYFFKQVKKNDEEKYFPIYGTATHIGSFVGKFAVAGFLLFLPENYAYLVIGIFMGLIGIYCLKIRD